MKRVNWQTERIWSINMKKVITIIVTYNRKELLKECLDAVLGQTYSQTNIFIIDNASNDGTYNFLKGNGYLDIANIVYSRLEKNCGGAGGFYEGIKRAEKLNPDWYWLMDDDTIPDTDALEKLILARSKINHRVGYLASCVEGINQEPMNLPEIDITVTDNGYSNWQEYLRYGMVRIRMATFVSLLVSGEAVKKCGLPCRDYFIWGDDSEYTTRIAKYYAAGYLVGSSKVCHKRTGSKNLSLVNETEKNRINQYFYGYRNGLVNSLIYGKKTKVVKELCFRLFTIVNCIGTPYGVEKAYIILKGSISGFKSYSCFKKYILKQIKQEGTE